MTNIFKIPKDVFCPIHNKKIQWMNISKNCLDHERLFCVDCQRPNLETIISYKTIMEIIYIEKEDKLISNYQEELLNVKETIISQLAEITQMIELLHSIYYQHPVSTFTYLQSFEDKYTWEYNDLLELCKLVSNKVRLENNQISFQNPLDQQDLEKIQKCIKIFEQCSKDIAGILNLHYPVLQQTLLRKPSRQEDEIITVKYELIAQQFHTPISALLINWEESFIAAAQNKINNYDILIFGIDKKHTQLSQLNVLRGHKQEIILLDKESNINLISVDKCLIIFWSRHVTKDTNHFERQFNVEMEYITCIKFHPIKNYLAIGGNQLQVWKLDNSPQVHIQNIDAQVNCLSFNKQVTLLVSGNNQGVTVFQFNNDQWEQIHYLKTIPCQHVEFTSSTNFTTFQQGFITKWIYDPTFMEYESKVLQITQKDNAIYSKEQMIQPLHESPINCQKYSFACDAAYLLDSQLKLYASY